MRIGELSRTSGCDVETIRYYEREGLLDAPRREANGYRRYDDGHLVQLNFVRHCRSLDMTLDEIRVLLRFKDAPQAECGEVNALLDEHIGHVATRIRELRQLEKQLKALREQCSGVHEAAHCGILNELVEASALPRAGRRAAPHVGASHARGSRR